MKIKFDKNETPVAPKVYIGNGNNKLICPLIGIREESFEIVENLNNTYSLSGIIDRYLDILGVDDNPIVNPSYQFVDKLLRIKIKGLGWFIIETPTVDGDGYEEYKTFMAQSADIEFQQHDLEKFYINKGTTDSYEMRADGNVQIVDGNVEWAFEQVKFYNKKNPQLSLLDLALENSGIKGWKIGYVDPSLYEYKSYENGELVVKYESLPDAYGQFDVEKQDLYSFLTQTVSQYFNCVFIFDFDNFIINVYRPASIGKNTNINLGFRNLENSNSITSDDNNLFTRYRVYGADQMTIESVNFGSNIIENLQNFLDTRYMSEELIIKYRNWQKFVETKRPSYISATKQYNSLIIDIGELENRVPLDDCSTDWTSFPDDKLIEVYIGYIAQQRGYEAFYVDDRGNFDLNALKASSDWNDYLQIKEDIIPAIRQELHNRYVYMSQSELTDLQGAYRTEQRSLRAKYDSDKDFQASTDYNQYLQLQGCIDEIQTVLNRMDSQGSSFNSKDEVRDQTFEYETNWDLYGLSELDAKLSQYNNTISVLRKGGYDKPYTEDSGHTEEYHTKMYNKYLDAVRQTSQGNGTCYSAYLQRKKQIEDKESEQKRIDDLRKEIAQSVDKAKYGFTEEEIITLSKYYIDNDYSNENVFLVSTDDVVSMIDEQMKLLSCAMDDLDVASQIQYIYTTSLDNFLAMYEYSNYIDNFNVGDFLYLGLRDDYVVKLRAVSLRYYPLLMDNQLEITFSNMIRSKSGRNDFSYLLGAANPVGKNTVTGSGAGYGTNDGQTLTAGMISQLISSAKLANKISQIVNNNLAINGGGGNIVAGSITVEELKAKLAQIDTLEADNAFVNYLQSQMTVTDEMIANNATIGTLDSKVAAIDLLLSGSSSTELGHIINLTAENVQIAEAVVAKLLAGEFSAGTINTDKIDLSSDDGGLTIKGNTMIFSDVDADGNSRPRIQIGKDSNGDFTFTLYDETGKGVLIDENGIHESAISDGLIVNDMVANGTLSKDKLNFSTVTANADGTVDAAYVKVGDQGLDVWYQTIEKNVENVTPYVLYIQSSNGRAFTRGRLNTFLTPVLYYGNENVTDNFDFTHFIWTRQSADSTSDGYWNSNHSTGTKNLHITTDDVLYSADFTCTFYIDNEAVATATL